MVCSFTTCGYGPSATGRSNRNQPLPRRAHTKRRGSEEGWRTVADFFHDERVEADLVDALVQAVGLVDLPQFFVEHHLLGVRQLRAQDPVVELL